MANSDNLSKVSVIIPTKNSARTIGVCLKSIKEQDYKGEVEVIVVDNYSSDETLSIAKKFTENIYSAGPERSAQRNFGAQKSTGEYLSFLDADMILSKGVIEECVERMKDQDIVAFYIPEKILGESFWLRVRDFERSFYNATVVDCVRFVRRESFLKIGGFDENLTGPEDWDFDRRINQVGKTGITDAFLIHNEISFDLQRFLKKKHYYSQAFGRYIEKWGKDDLIIRKQLGWQYRLFGVFFERGKWKKLLRHPGLALGMYSLRFLVGINYILTR